MKQLFFSSDSYLKLEDVCRRFRNPSILDVKIGRVSYDPEADDRKRSAERAKYPPLAELGFQLLGMRVRPNTRKYSFYQAACRPTDICSVTALQFSFEKPAISLYGCFALFSKQQIVLYLHEVEKANCK